MAGIAPIARGEFLQFFQRCMPPGGWPECMAVANSAGPDSVCLLYLISNLVKEAGGTLGLPREVWSIHVNHDLQPANTGMAVHAESIASRFGVPSCLVKIPWSRPPFPPKPKQGEPLERIARAARQNRLFSALLRVDAHCIAFGHHADDQVETAIIRLTMGSGELGIAGMRPVRRWGMGAGLEATGVMGMDRWIVRPLLPVSKDRVLATCAANDLDFVTDQTNYQPALTARNFVRQYLSDREKGIASGKRRDCHSHHVQAVSDKSTKTTTVDEQRIRRAIDRLAQYTEGDGSLAHLREAVHETGRKLSQIDMQASIALDRCLLPSPPSTLLLSIPRLREIGEHEVRISVVRRILRYTSPRGWGDPRAVINGNGDALEHLVRLIWEESGERQRFSLGSRVSWQPAIIRSDGGIRMHRPIEPGEGAAWLVTRDPPWSPSRNANDNEPKNLTQDCTRGIIQALLGRDSARYQLYDNRFCVRFQLDQIPREVTESLSDSTLNGGIIIKADSPWHLPRVLWHRDGEVDQILAEYRWREWDWKVDAKPIATISVPWIHMSFIRSLEAV